MGIVPENEHLLGLEGAGIVRRVASDVTTYKPGDRVVVFEKGTFANRIQVTTERTHKIPDHLSYTDAATITGVYLTSLYSLFNLANLQKGDSVLIHSAAGGIGISAIKLAQYKQAEIYVTVGTEDKRLFLESEFGIPRSRMFSSRSTTFAKEILAATGGRGVDVILNSLTGELLDETWRICADGGTMVEIGKRDILDRKQLAMEPFDRNCSYRALDFSHKQISDTLIAEYEAWLSFYHCNVTDRITACFPQSLVCTIKATSSQYARSKSSLLPTFPQPLPTCVEASTLARLLSQTPQKTR
jgi:NADPH:quinone reductase-like Zn-dependent oxidoreductase